MNIKKLLEKLSPTDFPAVLGGCRNDEKSVDCCEYDITVFDDKNENDSIIDFDNETVRIHHGSLKETNPDVLIQYSNMQIIWDEKWELRIFLSQISAKREKFFNAHSKIIQKKHDYFVKNSLISDCYFYLGYINRNNFIKIKDTLHRKPELIHVLKVAFDVENDMTKLELQTSLLHKTTNDLLSILNG